MTTVHVLNDEQKTPKCNTKPLKTLKCNISLLIIPCMIVYVTNNKEPLNLDVIECSNSSCTPKKYYQAHSEEE